MNLNENSLYCEDLDAVSKLPLLWDELIDRTVVITGGSGLIGSALIDTLMWRNRFYGQNCRIFAIGRNINRARERFAYCFGEDTFQYVVHDVNKPFSDSNAGEDAFVLHLASNTHPLAYAGDPIGTITTNIYGLKNMLDYSCNNASRRFVFASSNEIYGENRGDTEFFDEAYCGYIDCNTLRAGYPESKRCGEALCQAYMEQRGIDVVIPRFTRSYGPTMLLTDSKAVSQFIKNSLSGRDIILKSAGSQFYSYTYVMDAVGGLLTVMLAGEPGQAYNIADASSDITLKELAQLIAECSGVQVVFESPDDKERKGYSTATKARIQGGRLKGIGWKPRYDIRSGITRTIRIMRECGVGTEL